ncbi:hypothetical protein HY947_04995 [Candidatus Gottesmanbacteria bacterium]|nr:hypothetical protein [Candidatus Gottesmanbacteria bacterium]
MYWNQSFFSPMSFQFPPAWMMWGASPFMILDIVLKGFALWRAAQRKEQYWFIALLIVNSLGILPGFYLLTHQDDGTPIKSKKLAKKSR